MSNNRCPSLDKLLVTNRALNRRRRRFVSICGVCFFFFFFFANSENNVCVQSGCLKWNESAGSGFSLRLHSNSTVIYVGTDFHRKTWGNTGAVIHLLQRFLLFIMFVVQRDWFEVKAFHPAGLLQNYTYQESGARRWSLTGIIFLKTSTELFWETPRWKWSCSSTAFTAVLPVCL